ncbi:MAG: exodeoxyribonuclease VII small subunit [Lachnospiraceae bacterium]|nr:exodeoxyribonuclease VII small subunit [Lachnospiraceae bacterium]
MAKKDEGKKISLEESFEMLDQLIEEMESDEISLEDSFTKYEQGMKLLRECNDTLDTVEKKIQIIRGVEEEA